MISSLLQRTSGSSSQVKILGSTALAAAIVYLLPFIVSSYQLVLLTSAAAAAVAILGLNLLFGYTGLLSVGHAAFVGMGAYTAGILFGRYDWSFIAAILAAIALSFVVGLVISVPALRLTGLYLALVTIAFGAMFPSLVRRFSGLTNGDQGIFGLQWDPPGWTSLTGLAGQQVWAFWVAGAIAILAFLVSRNIISSRVGRSLVAIRDNPTAASSMGIPVARTKAISFAVAGSLGALGGALMVASIGVVSPVQFGLLQSIELLVAMVIGGAGTLRGPIYGGLFYVYVPYYTSELGSGAIAGVLFAGAVLLAVYLAPNGVDGLLVSFTRRVRSRITASRHPASGEPPVVSTGSVPTEAPSLHKQESSPRP